MKKRLLFCAAIVCATLTAEAQVKIGDNPNSINPNSLVEMESTNKGLLAPRVALSDVNSVSPLTGTVPAGMIVYSTGGAVTDGFYFWSGSKWLAVQSSENANSATALDVSGITSITEAGNLKNTAFVGTGTKVTGTFSKKWEVEAAGLNTEKDAVATGTLYVSSSANTIIATSNTPEKVAGTTTATELTRFTSPVNNRLVYDGTKTRTFIVTAAISVSGVSGSHVYSFYIFKNGAEITASRQRTKVSSTVGDVQIVTIVCTVTLSPGDYVELWTENNSSAGDLNVQNMTLSIK